MRVVVAGSSGLIGTALVAHLRAAGHDVLRLVRRDPAAPDERGWDPPAGRIDAGTFDGVDAVVNLNGVGIADRPWSGARRQAIRDSRNVPTEVLAAAVAEHGVPALLSAPANGYYGDTGGVAVDESHPPGSGFLAEIAASGRRRPQRARDAGARVVPCVPGWCSRRRVGSSGRSSCCSGSRSAAGSAPGASTCRGSRSTTRSAPSGSCWSTARSPGR